jgi:transitional endoplasmic reticulum ATPase
VEVQVVFRRTGSTQFALALELARREPTFRESAQPPKEYSVVYTQDTLDRYRDLMAVVGRWSHTRVFLNKQPVDRERLEALVACYLRRLAAPDRRAYCAGAEVHETRVGAVRQLFPCRMIPISESNHRGWFQYGRLTKDKVFVVDKAQLRQAVYEHLERSLARHCPALFPAEIDGIIDRLPDRIDPARDPQWTWKEGWHNGHFTPVGVEKRVQPAARAVASSSPGAGPLPRREVPPVRWRDVGGLGPQVRLIRENLELPLRFPELFERLGIEPHRGVLLAGPPGTGKTLLAKALANECQAHFCLVNGPEVLSKWHGESEANLRRVFEEARALQPAVILIDEIDSIAPDRGRVTHNFEAVLVSQLLALMDGLFDRGRVVVVGTTNRPQDVDPALRRPGRLDLLVEIGLPDAAGRAEILRIHTRRMPLGPDVDLDQIAAEAEGYAGADLASVCREAGLACMREVVRVGAEGEFRLEPDALARLLVRAEHFRQAMARVRPRVGVRAEGPGAGR